MLFSQVRRDMVFARWSIGTHPDHQTSRVLTSWAWLAGGRSFDLFFYEAYLGEQAMGVSSTDYVDFTRARAKKRPALFAHRNWEGERAYSSRSEVIENFRDREAGTAAAKAFVGL